MSVSSFSQMKDFNSWTGAKLKADASKKMGLSIEFQGRFYQNSQLLKQYFTDMGAKYDLNKSWALSLNYRLGQKNNEPNMTWANRLYTDFSFDKKIKPLDLKYKIRFRYQYEFDRLRSINTYIVPNQLNTIRLKGDVSYKHPDFKRIQPFMSAEIFKDFTPYQMPAFIQSYRLVGGLTFDLPKKHELELSYMFQSDIDQSPNQDFILSLQYTYKLPDLYHKKKKSN